MQSQSKDFWEIVPEEMRLEIHSIEELKNYKKGEFLFYEGEEYKGFYILQQGAVKVFNSLENGKESVHALFLPGEVFAAVPVFCENTTYPASAESLSVSQVYFYPCKKFKAIMQKHPEFMYKFGGLIMEKVGYYQKKTTSITSQSLADRIINVFKELGAERKWIEPPVGLKQLAALLGVTPEGFSRELARLEANKRIFRRNTLFSLKPKGLKSTD
ncbi:MAG: Crp/Fnr family transcriptional regulator [Spirochaetia bacterium]|nr:Crp/Fnr family transcriptional regulator [Spirochaetia bacterium]